MSGWGPVSDLLFGHVTVGEGLQEGDDGELLPDIESQVAQLGSVDIDRHFWFRPIDPGDIPGVVEMDDLPE